MYIVGFAIFVGALTTVRHYHEPGSVMETEYSAFLVIIAGLILFGVAIIIMGLVLFQSQNEKSDQSAPSSNLQSVTVESKQTPEGKPGSMQRA